MERKRTLAFDEEEKGNIFDIRYKKIKAYKKILLGLLAVESTYVDIE